MAYTLWTFQCMPAGEVWVDTNGVAGAADGAAIGARKSGQPTRPR